MPTRSKFTHAARESVLEAIAQGASLREAARRSNVSHVAVLKWLERGRISEPGGRYHDFFAAVWKLTHAGEGDAPVVPIGTGRRLDATTKARLDAFFAAWMADIATRAGCTVEELEQRIAERNVDGT